MEKKLKRINLNSQTLQKKFKKIYEELFSQNPLVVSAPGNFFWGGEHAVLYGALGIKQNLPCRVYVGIQTSSKTEIEISNFYHFLPSQRKFEKYFLPEDKEYKLIKFLKTICPPVKINVISEVPISRGLSSSGAATAALSTAIFLYNNKISAEEINKWKNLSASSLIKNQKFDQIFRLAWKIESILHGGSSSGSGPFCSLIGGEYPIIYFTEARKGKFSDSPRAKKPINLEGHYEILDQISFWGIRIEELLNLKEPPGWPIDFGLIYCGEVFSAESSIKSTLEVKKILEKVAKEIKENIKTITNLKKEKRLFFYDILQKKEGLRKAYYQSCSVISLEILSAFNTLFTTGFAEEVIKKLFRGINCSQKALYLINASSWIMDYICQTLQNEIKKLGDEYGIGTKSSALGKKGDILFVVVYHGLRDQIDRIINKMREETKEDIWLDYASWLDGIENEGIKIEQCLKENIYSSFISKGALLIKHLNQRGEIHEDLYSLDEFEKDKEQMDILLDDIEKDIFIKGKILTSKNLPSAKATVEILKILLENSGKWINRGQLPESPYSSERSELQSKIVSPLVKVVKKRLGKNLNLKISGGLIDFSIKLEPGIDIYLIEKKF